MAKNITLILSIVLVSLQIVASLLNLHDSLSTKKIDNRAEHAVVYLIFSIN